MALVTNRLADVPNINMNGINPGSVVALNVMDMETGGLSRDILLCVVRSDGTLRAFFQHDRRFDAEDLQQAREAQYDAMKGGY